MTENKMYSQRVKNIPVMRYCGFGCVYCAFQKFQKISSCQKCRDNVPHSHMEVLSRTPPKTQPGEFLSVGLSGDVSYMKKSDFWQVIEYCRKWKDRTFLIQSKNPAYFLRFQEMIAPLRIPDNVILGTTIETNKSGFDSITDDDYTKHKYHDYADISRAPFPIDRYEAMLKLTCRKAVTIEPVLDFNIDILFKRIKDIAPEFCYAGYCNDGHEGKRLRLPEPPLKKTLELITRLRDAGIEVREKTIRKAFYE